MITVVLQVNGHSSSQYQYYLLLYELAFLPLLFGGNRKQTSGIHRQRPFFLYTDSRYLCLEVGECFEIEYGRTADWTLCALANTHKSIRRCNVSDDYLPILLQQSK